MDVKKNAFSETGCIEFRMEKKELWPYHYSVSLEFGNFASHAQVDGFITDT